MADTTTTNYEFVKPEVEGSLDSWGTKLNANWDAVDALLKATDITLAPNKDTVHDEDRIVIKDTADNGVIKLVKMGYVRKNILDQVFPKDTVMLFAQSTAPTGWTKLTTHNDAALRVTSGSVSNGGTVSFTTAFKSQVPVGSISTTTITGSIGGTSLTVSNLPPHYHAAGSLAVDSHTHGAGSLVAASHTHGNGSLAIASAGAHTHTLYGGTTSYEWAYGLGNQASQGVAGFRRSEGNAYRSTLGSGAVTLQAAGAHSHTITGSTAASGALGVSGSTSAATASINGTTANTGSGTAHIHSFTGNSHNHEFSGEVINLTVKYVDVIMAVADATYDPS